jgi:hypothetical protein
MYSLTSFVITLYIIQVIKLMNMKWGGCTGPTGKLEVHIKFYLEKWNLRYRL